MKVELDLDYDITVDNMVSPSPSHAINGFKLDPREFYNSKMKLVKMTTLSRVNADFSQDQILTMKDGLFILEIEQCGEVEYFSSNDINDLL
jgi:hypothetical protein